MKKRIDNEDAYKPEPVENLFKEWRKDPAYIAAYEALEPEFAFYESLLKAMRDAKLTQKEVAKRRHTSEAAVSRLFDIDKKRAPNWHTIMKFAAAVGKRPVLKFVDVS